MGKHSIEARKYAQNHGRGDILTAAEFMPEAEADAKVSRFGSMLKFAREKFSRDEQSERSRGPRRLLRKIGGVAVSAIAFAELMSSPAIAEAPAPTPASISAPENAHNSEHKLIIRANGAGDTRPAYADQRVPVAEGTPAIRAMNPDGGETLTIGYSGRIINFPVSLGESGALAVVGPGGYAGAQAELRNKAEQAIDQTDAREGEAESLGTPGIYDAFIDKAIQNPDKQYHVKIVVSPDAPEGFADDLDKYSPELKAGLKLVGIDFGDKRKNIPGNLSVDAVTAEGDLWSTGFVGNQHDPNPGKFDLRQTIEGTFGGHYGMDTPTGSQTYTATLENGHEVNVQEYMYDKNRAGKTVAAMANSALVGVHDAAPDQLKPFIPTSVGDEVYIPDVVVDMQNPIDPSRFNIPNIPDLLPHIDLPELPKVDLPTILAPAPAPEAAPAPEVAPAPTYPDIQGKVVPQAEQPAPAPQLPSFEALQTQVQKDFQQTLNGIDAFAAQNGIQLPPLPGLPH